MLFCSSSSFTLDLSATGNTAFQHCVQEPQEKDISVYNNVKNCSVESEYIKKYDDDFENCSKAGSIYKGIVSGKELCSLKSNQKKYLIKKISDRTYQKQNIIADFVGAFILSKIESNMAPNNYLVVDKNGVLMGLASQIINNFVPRKEVFEKILPEKIPVTLYTCDVLNCPTVLSPYCRENCQQVATTICYSDGVVKANILANFIKQPDYHGGNVGYIFDDQGKIANTALVDFSETLNVRSIIWGDDAPTKYFGQINATSDTLSLIVNKFKVTQLDDLDDLFTQLCEKETLVKIKSCMEEQLENIKLQIQILTIVKNLMANAALELKDEDFNTLKNNSYILENFGLYNGENTFINFLCEKEDPSNIKYLRKLLSDNSKLISACAYYCLKNEKKDLLENLVVNLDFDSAKLLIKEVITISKSIGDLTIASNLLKELQKKSSSDDHYNEHIALIENAMVILQNPASNTNFGESLMDRFYSQEARKHDGGYRHNLSSYFSLYDRIIYTLVKIWLSQNDNTHIAPISENSICRQRECHTPYCFGGTATDEIFKELLKDNNILGMKNWFFWINISVMTNVLRSVLHGLLESPDPILIREILRGYDRNNLLILTESQISKLHSESSSERRDTLFNILGIN